MRQVTGRHYLPGRAADEELDGVRHRFLAHLRGKLCRDPAAPAEDSLTLLISRGTRRPATDCRVSNSVLERAAGLVLLLVDAASTAFAERRRDE